MANELKIVVVDPDIAVPEIKTIPDTIEAIQAIIGGYMEIGKVLEGKYLVVVNEDGTRLQLPMNRGLFYGTFFVCKQEGADMVSLNDIEANRFRDFFDMEKRLRAKGVNLD